MWPIQKLQQRSGKPNIEILLEIQFQSKDESIQTFGEISPKMSKTYFNITSSKIYI